MECANYVRYVCVLCVCCARDIVKSRKEKAKPIYVLRLDGCRA